MKKLILINSYCDDDYKINILDSYIDKLKVNNFDIFLYSPINLPNNITDKCNFYFRSSENPISDKMVIFWDFFQNIKLARIWFDSSWSSLYQHKVLSNLSLIYDYDIFYFTIYDLKLTDEMIEFINYNKESLFFKFGCFDPKNQENYVIKNCAMQFLSLLKKDILPFSLILQEKELSRYDSVESYLYWISNVLNIKVSTDFIVEDYICTWNSFHNFSIWEDFSLFFHNPCKLLFFNIKKSIDILLRTDNDIILVNLEGNYKELLLESDIKEIEIIYQEKKLDIMKKMKKNNCTYEIG